jgi:2-oxoglutarate ferredoxin oxidoreductase subunit alpha
VPLVVVDVMRGGPSTGIPTKSEQTDLNIAAYGLHGDAPHLVLAPTGIADCAWTTQWAVALAEALQVPAIVLSDQALGQSRAVIDAPGDAPPQPARRTAEPAPGATYRRYEDTEDGISPMALPGTPPGIYTADGLEHTEDALPSSRAADHARQLDKRLRKLTRFDYGPAVLTVEGDGPLAVITWGSATAAAREAVARARDAGVEARLVALRLIAPLPGAALARGLAGVRAILVVEQNHDGQLHRYLRAHHDFPAPVTAFHRAGPLALRPGTLMQRICALAATAEDETA